MYYQNASRAGGTALAEYPLVRLNFPLSAANATWCPSRSALHRSPPYLHALGAAGVPHINVYYRADGTVTVWPQLFTSGPITERSNRA